MIAANGAQSHIIAVFQYGDVRDSEPGLSGSSFSPTFLILDIPFFLFPIFFGLTARVIPLRSGLRVFCFVGSALKNAGFPPTMQTLACDSTPPRSLSCPK